MEMILRMTARLLQSVVLVAAIFVFAQPSSATTFWIAADGTIIRATSDPAASPPGAVTSTEIAPESGKQTWNFGTGAWNAPPAPPDPGMTVEDLWEVLRGKGVVTDADVPGDRRRPPRRP